MQFPVSPNHAWPFACSQPFPAEGAHGTKGVGQVCGEDENRAWGNRVWARACRLLKCSSSRRSRKATMLPHTRTSAPSSGASALPGSRVKPRVKAQSTQNPNQPHGTPRPRPPPTPPPCRASTPVKIRTSISSGSSALPGSSRDQSKSKSPSPPAPPPCRAAAASRSVKIRI
jgi:hypothetical protein